MENESSQQFCLRWHNHQSSVLGGLPALLDSGRLTDVTLCAGGRSLRAHKIVLSTCSPYFMDIFKDLPSSQQPVVLVLGGSWAELCCLVAFMYAGEVTLPRALLPGLLRLAKMLRITGLTDLNGNLPETGPLGDCDESFLPNLETDPMRFSRQNSDGTSGSEAVSSPFQKSAEKKLSSQTYEPSLSRNPELDLQEDLYQNLTKNFFSKQQHEYVQQDLLDSIRCKAEKGIKKIKSSEKRYMNPILNELESKNRKIDKIVENLKFNQKKAQNLTPSPSTSDLQFYDMQKNFLKLATTGDRPQIARSMSSLDFTASKPLDVFGCGNFFTDNDPDPNIEMAPENLSTKAKDEMDSGQEIAIETKCPPLTSSVQNVSAQSPTNTKLFATCYVCHKQLSNQYNLRVHLETHQNTRHACVACNHISRSRDALRKHVSYRHPQLTSSHGVGRPSKSSQSTQSTGIPILSSAPYNFATEDKDFTPKPMNLDETNDNIDNIDKSNIKK